jgi:cytochrome c-type biogenesis protein CcmH
MKRILIVCMCLIPMMAIAGVARDRAEDPILEKRMIVLAEKLRCLVCQNESLASSHSDLAEDLRREVREQMNKGMSDDEIIDYLVERYGDFVLYDPRVKSTTLLLWFGPFLLLGGGGVMLFYQLRKRKRMLIESEIELTPEAVQRASELLNEQKDRQT